MIIDIVLGKALGRGGVETVLTLLCRELVERGHRVRVFQTEPPDYPEWAETLPEIYYYDTDLLRTIKGLNDKSFLVRYALGYQALLKEMGYPDIVLATHTPALSKICRLALNSLGGKCPPILSWLHGPPEAYGGNVEELKLADAHLTISHTIGRKIKAIVGENSPIIYVGNPIAASDFTLMERNPSSVLKLIYIGRMNNHEKRLDILFQALSTLKGEWTLTLIGDGPDREYLKRLADELKIDERLYWTGWQDNPWKSVEAASLLVLSSDYEGFGMVLVESLARGLPVLSTDTEGPLDIISHGVNGWLYPVRDYEALNRILQDIINQTIVLPSAQVCIESVSNYQVTKVADRFEEAFYQTIESVSLANLEMERINQNFLKDNWLGQGMDSKESERRMDELERQVIQWLAQDNDHLVMKQIRQMESTVPGHPLLEVFKARLAIKQGNVENVLGFLQKVERINPNRRVGILIAEILGNLGNSISSLKQYFRYVQKEDTELIHQMSKLLSLVSKPKISLITNTFSGCNATTLARLIPDYITQKYDVRLFREQSYENYDSFVKESEVVVTTQAGYPFTINQYNVELWNGFPLKGMSNMDLGESQDSAEDWNNVDCIMSYSGMFNTLFNACVGARVSKYRITGAPRNDLLIRDNKEWFSDFFGTNLNGQRLLLYSPAFRSPFFNPTQNDGNRSWGNLFDFDQFNTIEFETFLKENQLYLVVKLHPAEEKLLQEKVLRLGSSRIKLLTEADVADSGFDFYELLGSIDLLITDYSSIYFDYLLLNRPIIFAPVDLEAYREKRGFLLEPYDYWTPGPKVLNQTALENEILSSLNDNNYFKNEREQIKKIVHHYDDFSAAERVWKHIDDLLNLKEITNFVNDSLDIEVIASSVQFKARLTQYIEANEIKKAQNLMDLYEDKFEKEGEILTVYATVSYLAGNSDKALQLLNDAYVMNPTYFDTLYSLGVLYEEMKEYQKSEFFYILALNNCPDEESKEQLELKLADFKIFLGNTIEED